MELLVLLEDITSDGVVSAQEAKSLAAWLATTDTAGIAGIVYLRGILDHVLSDGSVTPEEQKAIYDAIEKVLPVELRREARERRKLALATEKLRIVSANVAQRAEEERKRPRLDLDLIIAGASHGNRQNTISNEVRVGMPIVLDREPDNPYDRNAIRVSLHSGSDIGYINRSDASSLAPILDRGAFYAGHIKKVHFGSTCNMPIVLIKVFDANCGIDGARPAGLKAYVPSPEDAIKTAKSAGGTGCSGCLAIVATCIVLLFVYFVIR